MLRLSVKNISLPSGKYQIEFQIPGLTNGSLDCRLVSMGTISIGSDEDSDLLMFPSNVKISVSMKSITDFGIVLNTLKFNTLNIKSAIYKYDESSQSVFYNGVLNREYTYDYEKRIFKFEILDNLQELKNITSVTNPLGLDLMDTSRVLEMVELIVKRANDSVQSVQSNCKYNVEIDKEILNTDPVQHYVATVDPDYYNPAVNAGKKIFLSLYNSLYFGSNSTYENLAEVLKSIMSAIGCVGMWTFGNTFMIRSRYWNGEAAIIIDESNMVEVSNDYIAPISKFKINVYTGGSDNNGKRIYAKYTIGDQSKPEEVETITIDYPGGIYDFQTNNSWQGLGGRSNEFTPEFVLAKDDKSYLLGPDSIIRYSPLWTITAWMTLQLISSMRSKFRIKLSGIGYRPSDFFEFLGDTFIAKKLEYDFIEDTTLLTLAQVPGIIHYERTFLGDTPMVLGTL